MNSLQLMQELQVCEENEVVFFQRTFFSGYPYVSFHFSRKNLNTLIVKMKRLLRSTIVYGLLENGDDNLCVPGLNYEYVYDYPGFWDHKLTINVDLFYIRPFKNETGLFYRLLQRTLESASDTGNMYVGFTTTYTHDMFKKLIKDLEAYRSSHS